MTPLPHPRAAILHSPTRELEDEPVAVIAVAYADFLVVGLDGMCHVVPFGEVQVVDPAIRLTAQSALREVADRPEAVTA